MMLSGVGMAEGSGFNGGQALQPGFHLVDDGVGGGGAGSDADGFGVVKQVGAKLGFVLHLHHPPAVAAACRVKLPCVVAMMATDDDDHVAFLRQLDRRPLPLFRRLTDRVRELNLGAGKALPDERHQALDPVDGLGGLGNDPVARLLGKIHHIFLGKDHVEAIEVLGETPDFNMITAADDDRMAALFDEFGKRLVREADERTGCFDDPVTAQFHFLQRALRGAVSGDHDGSGGDIFELVTDLDAVVLEGCVDTRVVDEFAQDGEGSLFRMLRGQLDGVADAETHTEMICSKDFHGVIPRFRRSWRSCPAIRWRCHCQEGQDRSAIRFSSAESASRSLTFASRAR